MSTITEYSPTEAALAELRTKYADAVFPVATTKGMTEAKAARAELREKRVALEKMRVDIKAPALERCRQIDTEAKRITAEISALEDPIDEQIKAEENRKAIEKAAKEQAEREEQERTTARFNAVKALPLAAIGVSADAIRALIQKAQDVDGTGFSTDVLRDAFKFERDIAVAALKAALDRQLMADAEAAKIVAERAELERLRAEADAVRAEADRQAQAERDRVAKAEAERLAAERAEEARVEAEQRAMREAAEKAAREAREQEQARIDAERAEQRRREDAERAEAARQLREEQEAAAAERARLERERKEAAAAARKAEIANADLLTAAREAVAFLKAKGYGEELVCQKLDAATNRTQKKAA